MTGAEERRSVTEVRFDWLGLGAGISLIAGVMVLLMWQPATDVGAVLSPTGNAENVELTLAQAQALSEGELAVQQRRADQAALDATGVPALSAPLTSRPAYVSPVEWLVLTQVAAQSASPEKKLVRLVNKLRFTRQVALFQAHNGAVPAALAQQVLDDIPVQVEQMDLARAEAHQLQRALLATLEPDPLARRERLQAEAQRIGVVFDVSATP